MDRQRETAGVPVGSCRLASFLTDAEVTLYGDDNRGICPWSYRSKRDLHVDGATRKGDIYLP